MSETPTPTNDEWIVTDNENYVEIASIKTRDSIASVHGGKTVGEQYEIAARIANLPRLERELSAVTEQRDRLSAVLKEAVLLAVNEPDFLIGYFISEDSPVREALQSLNQNTNSNATEGRHP